MTRGWHTVRDKNQELYEDTCFFISQMKDYTYSPSIFVGLLIPLWKYDTAPT